MFLFDFHLFSTSYSVITNLYLAFYLNSNFDLFSHYKVFCNQGMPYSRLENIFDNVIFSFLFFFNYATKQRKVRGCAYAMIKDNVNT